MSKSRRMRESGSRADDGTPLPSVDWSWRDPRVWLVPALALIGALALFVADANERVFLFLNGLGSATGDAVWANLNILGDTTVALALCLVLARRRPDLLWAVVPAGLVATAWARAFKPLVNVMRPPAVLAPDAIHLIGPAYHYHSFPSGHATTAFALAALCVVGFRLRTGSVVPIAIAVLVCASRSVAGVHWPLDLFGGAFGGWLAGTIGLTAAPHMRFGLHPLAQWIVTLATAGCAIALLAGYQTAYPQTLWFQYAIGLTSLAAFALTFLSRRAALG